MRPQIDPIIAFLGAKKRDLGSGFDKIKKTLHTRAHLAHNAQELTTGLYHEFAPALKILSVPQVQELYKSKKNYFALEERYGLR